MRFIYEYRTSDNVRHEGVVDAADREAAFTTLKAQGIRPGSVREAPGFFNKLFGKGKRWLAIGALSVLCCVLGYAFYNTERSRPASISDLDSLTRRQVIGDAAIIEMGIRTGWAEVFPEEGERYLADFAVPGVSAKLRNCPEEAIRAALARKVGVDPSDGIEARQVKAIVEGMKEELRQFLKAGGSIAEYGRRLLGRQETELGYYMRAKAEVQSAYSAGMSTQDVEALWERRNASLRRMGIRLIPLPENF